MANRWNDEELTFIDSWKDKEVELAATAAIVVGAGVLAAKGQFPNMKHHGENAMKQAGKGFERYVKKSANPAIRNAYNIGSNAFKGLRKGKLPSRGENYDNFMNTSTGRMSQIKEDELKVRADRQYADDIAARAREMDTAKALGKEIPDIPEVDPIRSKEKARQAMVDEMISPKDEYGKPKKPSAIDPGEVANNLVGSGIAAIGFGGGISAYHMVNDQFSEKNKKRDKTFEAAGSYYKRENRNGDDRMRKHAGARELHDGLASLAGKVPAAAATGIGFTGVSLASANMLNKKKKEEDGSNGNRIIIELGDTDPTERSNSGHATAGGLGMLPRPEFAKSAGIQSFLNNVGGRQKELKPLKKRIDKNDYKASAADSLKGTDIDAQAKSRYGHVFNDERAKEQLFDEKAHAMKNADDDRFEQIKDEVAVDRIKGLTGLGIAGLAGGGIHHLRNKEEKPNEW